MQDLTGKVIDKYSLVRLLGEGGMGAVYEGEHIMVRKRCAVKVLHPELSGNMEVVQRMMREAQAAAAISHPNIVETHDFGVTPENVCYMVMDYLEGESLDTVIRHLGRLDVKPLVATILQVLSALVAAHAKKIVHRDLKPENIFIAKNKTGGEVVKLLDFGISKFMLSESDTGRLTHAGIVMGTPLYMSPEQASGAEKVDARSDIWSMGVVLYEALTGKLPFDGDNYNQIIVQIITKGFAPPRQHRRDISEELEAVILKALQKDPAERFQRAAQMIDALLPFYDRTESEAGRFVLRDTFLDKLPARRVVQAASQAGVSPAPAVHKSTTPRFAPEAQQPSAAGVAATVPKADPQPAAAPAHAPEQVPTQDPSPVQAPAQASAEAPVPQVPAPMQSVKMTALVGSPEVASTRSPGAGTMSPGQVAGRVSAMLSTGRSRKLMIIIGAGAILVIGAVVAIILAVGGASSARKKSGPRKSATDSSAMSMEPTADSVGTTPIESPDSSMTGMHTTMNGDTKSPAPMGDAMAADGSPLVIQLEGLPGRASVRLDGSRTKAPLKLLADGKRHRLEVRSRGYRVFVTHFRAIKGLVTLTVKMRRKGAGAGIPPQMKGELYGLPKGDGPPMRRTMRPVMRPAMRRRPVMRRAPRKTMSGVYSNPFR
jgi:serine/threonine-protein kinase